jgi:replicative DNA helicase
MMDLGRIPPYSIEAEKSVLGAILIDSSIIDDVFELISADDFYNIRVQYGLDPHNVNDTMNRYNEWKKTIV